MAQAVPWTGRVTVTGVGELPRHLRLLWAFPDTRRGPRPGRTIQGIGTAAVALADEQGLPAVSMKAVAEALGVAAQRRRPPGTFGACPTVTDTSSGPGRSSP